jgi:hypothetical protein
MRVIWRFRQISKGRSDVHPIATVNDRFRAQHRTDLQLPFSIYRTLR